MGYDDHIPVLGGGGDEDNISVLGRVLVVGGSCFSTLWVIYIYIYTQ